MLLVNPLLLSNLDQIICQLLLPWKYSILLGVTRDFLHRNLIRWKKLVSAGTFCLTLLKLAVLKYLIFLA